MISKNEWKKLAKSGRLAGASITTYESGEKYVALIKGASLNEHGITLQLIGLICRDRKGKEEELGESVFTYDWETLCSAQHIGSAIEFNAFMLGDVRINLR